ncbi:MAG: tRNA (adenosine(37)-N6)-threonylcarbamoyltransferase complex ATPase subunit type 1 TsaE [Proteobacteria bacterium]|nr:tRNA (adenosine(37)-N6)-threonylcarbamoyltransferase complex ATPase subunit type 1 TsaE [Pseudomonadota bacterium]
MSQQQIFLEDEAATLEFGKQLAQATFVEPLAADNDLVPGRGVASIGGVLHLHGDLGAGKTTLARGILRGYGYLGAVKSPTYTLVEPYEFDRCQIIHIDFYRLSSAEEVEYLGIEDYFAATNLCLIEWAEKGLKLIPAADLKIEIESDGTGRLLKCQNKSAKGALIAKRLWAACRNL